MHLHHKKAFLSAGVIISILLTTAAFIIILSVWENARSKIGPAAAEEMCEAFNSARVKFSKKIMGDRLTLIPNACKTIDKTKDNALPEKGYPQTKQGTEENIKRLIIKCWDMWLQGRYDNMFGTSWTSFGKQKCFVCYAFNIKKGIDFIDGQEFDISLSQSTYIAKDTSDKCALTDLGYAGGFCSETCSGNTPKETSSTKCSGKKCCIAKNKKDECINKGGLCKSSCDP